MLSRHWTWIVLVAVLGCDDNPGPMSPGPDPPSPDTPLRTISTLFNDRLRDATESSRIYDSLLSPDVVFTCPTPAPTSGEFVDCAYPFRPEQAREVFEGNVYDVDVQLTYLPPRPLDPLEEGREGWQVIMITNANVRVLFNVDDGLEVNGRTVRVLVAPQAGGEWVIAEWAVQAQPAVVVGSRGRKSVY